MNSSTRNGICFGCPEISIRIYGNRYPTNLIDIGNRTNEEISNSILKKADFVILHSWKS